MLTRREFIKYAAVGTASLAGISFLGCTQKGGEGEATPTPVETSKAKYKDTFVLGEGKDHKLDGGKWGIGFFPKIHVLERLVEYDMKNDELVTSLAEKWDVERDGKLITFQLRRGVRFSDGSELNAEAVKFTVEWLANKHPLGSETFESAEVVDDYTVSITYKDAAFFNLAKMAEFHMSIMSPNSVEPKGDPTGKLTTPIGTGPFKVADYKKNQYAVYEPNPYWYERRGIEPKFKRFVVKFIPDEDTRVMALRSGEVDAISDYSHGGSDYTPRNQLNVLAGDGYKVYKRNIPLTWVIAFNYEKEPFNDIELRRAVSLAVNRDEIVKIFDGHVRPAWNGMFAPEAPGMAKAGIKYEYNPNKAKEILSQKDVGEVSFIVDKSQGDQVLVAQLVQQQLKEVGFNVNLDVLEGGAYRQKRDAGDYDMRLYYIGGTDRRFYLRLYWRFHPETKWKAYLSPKTGELCKAILKEFDKAKREQYLIEFYKSLYEEMGVVPLYHDVMTVVTSPKVEAKQEQLFEMAEPFFYGVGVRL
jgi:peptide/nickel transport system substrate-binding protein